MARTSEDDSADEAREERVSIKWVGRVASAASVAMYVSYIPQIIDNLNGMKGNPVQPLVAAVNCTLWVIYALSKRERDLPIAIANAPGVLFGLFAFCTAI